MPQLYHNKVLTKIHTCTDQFHFRLDALKYIGSVMNPEITCKIIFSGNKIGQFKDRRLCDDSIDDTLRYTGNTKQF